MEATAEVDTVVMVEDKEEEMVSSMLNGQLKLNYTQEVEQEGMVVEQAQEDMVELQLEQEDMVELREDMVELQEDMVELQGDMVVEQEDMELEQEVVELQEVQEEVEVTCRVDSSHCHLEGSVLEAGSVAAEEDWDQEAEVEEVVMT